MGSRSPFSRDREQKKSEYRELDSEIITAFLFYRVFFAAFCVIAMPRFTKKAAEKALCKGTQSVLLSIEPARQVYEKLRPENQKMPELSKQNIELGLSEIFHKEISIVTTKEGEWGIMIDRIDVNNFNAFLRAQKPRKGEEFTNPKEATYFGQVKEVEEIPIVGGFDD